MGVHWGAILMAISLPTCFFVYNLLIVFAYNRCKFRGWRAAQREVNEERRARARHLAFAATAPFVARRAASTTVVNPLDLPEAAQQEEAACEDDQCRVCLHWKRTHFLHHHAPALAPPPAAAAAAAGSVQPQQCLATCRVCAVAVFERAGKQHGPKKPLCPVCNLPAEGHVEFTDLAGSSEHTVTVVDLGVEDGHTDGPTLDTALSSATSTTASGDHASTNQAAAVAGADVEWV